MSNISRRKFLKDAGVAALAVATAGVLAGCSGNKKDDKVPGTDVPDVPEVTSKTVTIYFEDADDASATGNIGATYEIVVLKDAKVVDPTLIPADKLPNGYILADTTPVEIKDNGTQTFAIVLVKSKTAAAEETETITVKTIIQPNTFGEATAVVPKGATSVYLYQITLPEGYHFASYMSNDTPYPLETNFFIEPDEE